MLHAPDSGSVTWSPAGARVGYLPQERTHVGTVGEHLAQLTGVRAADDRMQRAAHGLATGAPDADSAYSAALEDWLALGGPDLDARISATLARVAPGLPIAHPMAGLSGGQSARVGLAGLLLSRFDAYLLDEPTNDLDLDGLELAEQFLAGIRGPVLLVSHDREFLARRITRVLDFDPALEAVGDYRGGFDAYVAERMPCARPGAGGVRRSRRRPRGPRGADARRPGHLRTRGEGRQGQASLRKHRQDAA